MIKAMASDSSDDTSGSDDNTREGNVSWADSIAKVLSTTKPKTKKSLVLSRAKKLSTAKEENAESKKVDFGFEIEGEEIKEEKPDKVQLDEDVKHRKNIKLALRVKPTWKDIERERTLRKIATKGVVQLFNAVRTQQKDLQEKLEKAGPLDSRRDAVLNNIDKKKFLDVLMSGNRAKSEAVDNPVKAERSGQSSDNQDESDDENKDDSDGDTQSRKRKTGWDVLRSDFLTNKKVKHWDEENESSDNNSESSNENDDENNSLDT